MKKKEGISEKMIEVVSKVLDEIHNERFVSAKVEKQCQDRFSMGWDQVRKEMHIRISKGFELLPEAKNQPSENLSIKPEYVIEGICGQTGNWMINQFLYVLYLAHTKHKRGIDYYMDKINKMGLPELSSIINDKTYEHHIMSDYQRILYLLRIAPVILPEKVNEVLESHGLRI